MTNHYNRLADNIKALDEFLEMLREYRDSSKCEHPDVIEELETGLIVDYTERLVEIDDLKMQIEKLEKENKELKNEVIDKIFISLGWDFLKEDDNEQ